MASFDEIKENDFNLNIPRYMDTFEEEEIVDIAEVQRNIASIKVELAQVQAQMKKYLEELGLWVMNLRILGKSWFEPHDFIAAH